MIIDTLAASLPTGDIWDHTKARRRVLSNGGYIRKMNVKPAPEAVIEAPEPEVQPFKEVKPRFVDATGRDWIIIKSKRQIDCIKQEISDKYNIPVSELESQRRHRKLSLPRFEFYYRCRNETRHSLPEIGTAMGGRHHTTVIVGIRRYHEIMAEKEAGK